MAAKKTPKKSDTHDLVMHVIGMVDYDIAKYYIPETSEDPKHAAGELGRYVAEVDRIFDVKRK